MPKIHGIEKEELRSTEGLSFSNIGILRTNFGLTIAILLGQVE